MKYKYTTSIVIAIFTISISIISILKPDYKISQQEGRTLQELPLPSTFEEGTYKEQLLNGEAFKKWDNYFSDHIVGRGRIVNAYTDIQLLMGKKYINELYLGKDNELLEAWNFGDYNLEYRKNRANHFNNFAEKFNESKTFIVNLPNKNYAYEHKMPINNYLAGQSIYIPKLFEEINKEKIKIIDTLEEINKDDNNYYKTDHHMNMNGVYTSYKYIINNIRKDIPEISKPKEKSEFDIEVYKEVFIGSHGRSIPSVVKTMDDIEVYQDNSFTNYKAYNQDGEAKLFYREKISKDRLNGDYGVYLGGDNAIFKVENNQSNNKLKTVVIGDSMDNPLIPLLVPHFKELYSYDLRHYQGNVLQDIESINPDVILLIGISNNFLMQTDIFNWNNK